MLFDITGDPESNKNVKHCYLPGFARTVLRVAQNKLRDRVAVVFIGRIQDR